MSANRGEAELQAENRNRKQKQKTESEAVAAARKPTQKTDRKQNCRQKTETEN